MRVAKPWRAGAFFGMKNWLKILMVLALAAALASCGAMPGPTSALDASQPAPAATDNSGDSAARGTSSWIGDECSAKNPVANLVGSILSSVLGNGDSGGGNGNGNSQ
jgi:hypothetical protein